MITNPIPYPNMKDSGITWLGSVPLHSDMRRLKNVANLMMGQSLVGTVVVNPDCAAKFETFGPAMAPPPRIISVSHDLNLG